MSTDQISMLLFELAIIVALARLFGALARLVRQPPVIGEVLAGLLLGPTLFDGRLTDVLFPMTMRPLLIGLANIGVAVFMFIVGLEVDRLAVRRQSRSAVLVSIASIALPFLLGTGLAWYLAAKQAPDDRLSFVLFMGVAMSVTAFPVLARILADRGLADSPLGGLALACAAVDDVLAWTLLAGVVAITGAGGGNEWRLLLLVPYAIVMHWVVRPMLSRAARSGRLTPGLLGILAAGLLSSGALTEWIGLHFVFGAFLFGLVMPRDGAGAVRRELVSGLGQTSSVLLLPVFFLVAGLQVDLRSVGVGGLRDLGLIMLVAVGGKGVGAFLGARLGGLNGRESGTLSVLMNTRGLTELVILGVGLHLHLISQYVYSLMVVMAVVTTGMAGPLLTLLQPRGRRGAMPDAAAAVGHDAPVTPVTLAVGLEAPVMLADVGTVGRADN